MGQCKAGKALALRRYPRILGQCITPKQAQPAAIQGKKSHPGRRIHSGQTQALFIEPHRSSQIANPQGDHADAWFHRQPLRYCNPKSIQAILVSVHPIACPNALPP